MQSNRSTEEQVRELLAEYSPPSPPKCRKCGAKTKRTTETTESVFFRCPKCKEVAYFQNRENSEIVALCEDWLRMRAASAVHGLTADEIDEGERLLKAMRNRPNHNAAYLDDELWDFFGWVTRHIDKLLASARREIPSEEPHA